MEGQIKFANTWDYDGLVYGVPSTGNAQGVVYNKRVFTEAGVAETPKTPDEFIAALQAIKDYDSSICTVQGALRCSGRRTDRG